LDKLLAQRVTAHEAALAKETAAVEAAAAQQRQIWIQTTQDAIAIFRELGVGFEEALKPLQLEQQVAKWQQQIATLNTAIDQGRDTHGHFAKAIEVLTTKMDEAVKLGYVPMTEAAKTVTAVIDESAAAAKAAAASFDQMVAAGASYTETSKAMRQAWLDGTLSLQQYNTELDKALAKEKAGAFKTSTPASSPTPVTRTSVASGAGTTRGAGTMAVPGWWANVLSADIYHSSSSQGPESFQHGGIVPGVGPMPIIAHGGERIVPVHGESGARAVQVRIEPGAIQLSGTIIDQQRGWGSLVEELGQALEARLRRRAR
jgi:hypothetical protein